MTIAKIRNLSKYGVVTDVDPYNLPPEAFSKALNVRFHKGSVQRAPVFRRFPVSLAQTNPRFLGHDLPPTGSDTVYLGYLNGRVSVMTNTTETDVSIFGYVNNDGELPYTECHLGNVYYLNRADRVAWSRRVSDATFVNLANWDSNWRAQIMRACGGALVALNITKSGTNYPTMVKTSEFAQINTVPTTWDSTDPTNNATENILGEMEGYIVDAQNLGNNLVIYGTNECWLMSPSGDFNVWNYHKLPFEYGAVNANCVIEIGGFHYVFGSQDIWRHDGVSKESICEQIRSYLYSTIDLTKANRCFVYHDKVRKELRFSFASTDETLVSFLNNDGCNLSAIYDLVENTWTFDDLPYVYSAVTSNMNFSTLTYANVAETYDTTSRTYLDGGDSVKRLTVMVGDVSSTYSLTKGLYAVDQQGAGAVAPYAVDSNATKGWRLDKDGLDLDELSEDLRGYKICRTVFPQARLESGASPLSITAGGANNYNDSPTFNDAQTYDGSVYTQIDTNVTGRYLFVRITHADYHYVNLTGFDLDMDTLGEN
jgi:hypothetical protein